MENITIQDLEHGIIIPVDKPFGWSSFDAIRYVQRQFKRRFGVSKIKIGHAGTLDPMATGMLLLCVGAATKQIERLQDSRKEYRAILRLGAITPSYDAETAPMNPLPCGHITMQDLHDVLGGFVGVQQQIPPVYSAKVVDGCRAYVHARKGHEVALRANSIHIYSMVLLEFDMPYVVIKVVCSKGTYIRALARDIGAGLGCGAYLVWLRRTACGEYSESSMQQICMG
jgi:tRNA pseudouridine55 synthase